MVKNQNPTLTLIHEDHPVADLVYDLNTQNFQMIYTAEWMKKGFPLSPHLQFFSEIKSENIRRFLENLLPEGDSLKTLARTLQISSSNLYALIAAIGRDATGAFTFNVLEKTSPTQFRPIPLQELEQRILERSTRPISVWDGKPRLSLAGVQEKLAVTLKDGEYGLGEGELASTHILKFSKKDQHLVLNEFFCMTLAKKTGLDVAHVEMIRLGERVLQVERFDRQWKNPQHVTRIHVIDGCQALDAPPEFKYQRIVPVGASKDEFLGPINVANLSAFNQNCLVPAKAQLQLLHWILFNLIIGNTDNHGKNISYFVNKKGYEIAPAYDLVNVTVYDDFHHELAFKIGDTFDINEVKAFQLIEMAHEMNLNSRFVSTHLKKLAKEILKQLETIQFDDLNGEETQFLALLRTNIQTRAEKLLEQADLMGRHVITPHRRFRSAKFR